MNNVNDIVLSSLGHTWILDLDGTIVLHNGYKLNGRDSFLPGAKDFLMSIPDEDMIVFITSRKREFSDKTESFLLSEGIKYSHIIYDAPYGERILINDRKPSGLEMSIAVNSQRDVWCGCNIIIDESI